MIYIVGIIACIGCLFAWLAGHIIVAPEVSRWNVTKFFVVGLALVVILLLLLAKAALP